MFAVEWCRTDDLPCDEYGDAIHDAARFTVAYFLTPAEMLAHAHRLLRENDGAGTPTLAYGCVRCFEEVERRSRWTRRVERIEVRDCHLADIDEPLRWESIPDPEDE